MYVKAAKVFGWPKTPCAFKVQIKTFTLYTLHCNVIYLYCNLYCNSNLYYLILIYTLLLLSFILLYYLKFNIKL